LKNIKKLSVKKPGMANDCGEVEQIISGSIERMKEKHLHASIITDYLHKLKDGLQALSSSGFDYIHWCNIRCTILYLKS